MLLGVDVSLADGKDGFQGLGIHALGLHITEACFTASMYPPVMRLPVVH